MTKKDQQLQRLERESTDLVTQAKSIVVRTDDQYKAAAEFLLGIKALQTQITEHHEPMRAKAYDAYQQVLASRKKLIAPVEKAEKIVKGAMSAFMAKRIEKQERIAERIMDGGSGKVTKAPKPAGITARQTWDFEITDESKIDRAFLVPDLASIHQVVRSMGMDAEEAVGGIRVFRDVTIAGSRGS